MEMDFQCDKFWHRICGPLQQYTNLFFIAFKEQLPKDFFSDTVGSRDVTFCPKAEQDTINIGKIDNNTSRMKKQMKHMNKLPSVLSVLVSI